MADRAMVFGIGLSKTGTHSLTRALEILGIHCVHYPSPALMVLGQFEDAFEGFDAATDISVGAYFRELDGRFPQSRFILTTRDKDSWLASIADHRRRRDHIPIEAGCPKAAIRGRIYGSAVFDEAKYARAYDAHRDAVLSHFADRKGRLLEFDLCDSPSWEPMCAFLGRPIPAVAFPHANARSSPVA